MQQKSEAQSHKYTSVENEFTLFYRGSAIEIDSTYLDNTWQMDTIVRYLAKSPKIDSITIYAWASVEGNFDGNLRLSKKRAEAAKNFILANLSPTAYEPKIILRPMAENWDELLVEIEENYERPDREQVLSILRDSTITSADKKNRLKRLSGGRSWRIMIRDHMPRQRYATWKCVWEQPLPEKLMPIPTLKKDVQFPVPHKGDILPIEWSKPVLPEPDTSKTIFALKTNALYDLVTAFNAEIEFPIGDNFSLMVEDVFPWYAWGPNQKKYAFQTWEIGVEPRVWFGKGEKLKERNEKFERPDNYLTGHFVAPYVMSGRYDFQNDTKICYQGEAWSAGITYGYSLPISKNFNMEFALSVGYLRADYRHYNPDPNYEHLFIDKYKTGVFSYIGPTKLKITFSLPIRFKVKQRD